jgi:ribosomal protein S18 acetylase RimI-like enzyme
VERIANTINQAFADYLIPMQVTVAQLELKMKQEQIDLAWSAGAFNDDELVGFILHGYRDSGGKRLLYNAGTAVVPEWRGLQLTERMYRWVTDRATPAGVHAISLEVISGNDKAIHVYEKIGFRKSRHLVSWKGSAPEVFCKQPLVIEPYCSDLPWHEWQGWWKADPCWSAAPLAVEALGDGAVTLVARLQQKVVGYCSVVQHNARLLQLSVAPGYRKRGIGTALLSAAFEQLKCQGMLALNVDRGDMVTNRFFDELHWKQVVQQFEMTVSLQAS